jgi:predicted permease
VRTALGAGRRRLAAQLLAEGLLIGSLGGLCGVGVVLLAATTTLPESASIRAAPVAIALSVAMLSILAGLAIGALPAMRATRSAPSVSGVRGHAGGTAHGLLVAGELAVSVPLVLGAALLLSSFARLRSVDTGLDARGVLAIDVLAGDGDLDVEARRAFLLAATDRLAALPGIAGAASVQMLPLRERGWSVSVTTPDRPDLTGERRPVFYFRAITPAFHDVLGIRILDGRGVRPEDSGSARPVAVVGMALARILWPDGSAVGRTLRTGVDGDTDIEVVGVAEDIRVSGVRSAPDPVVYRPVAQVRYVPEGQTLVVKVDADPSAAVPVIRAALEATDRRVAIARVETFDSVVRAAIGDVTRASLFVTASALLALILGGLGVYGVASQLVARRTPEFGVRMALGASPAQVFGTVLRTALALIALGLAAGGLLFVFLARFLRTLLFDVRPGEPAVVIVCAGVLAGAAFVALTAPAVRAARTDPAAALRGD